MILTAPGKLFGNHPRVLPWIPVVVGPNRIQTINVCPPPPPKKIKSTHSSSKGRRLYIFGCLQPNISMAGCRRTPARALYCINCPPSIFSDWMARFKERGHRWRDGYATYHVSNVYLTMYLNPDLIKYNHKYFLESYSHNPAPEWPGTIPWIPGYKTSK